MIIISFNASSYQVEDQHWMQVPGKGEILEHFIGMRFENDTAYHIMNGGHYKIGPYRIEGTSLIWRDFKGDISIFKILKCTSDSLHLSTASSNTIKYYSRRLEYDPSLTFTFIKLETALDEWNCKFEVTVERNGKAVFKGAKKCAVKGKKKFNASPGLLAKMDSLFKMSKINDLDADQFYGNPEEPGPIKLVVKYNDQTKIFNATVWEVPYRLKGIVFYLRRELQINELL